MKLKIISVMRRRTIRRRRRSRLGQRRRRGKLRLVRMEMIRATKEILEKMRRMTRRNMMTMSRQRIQSTREKRSKMAGKFIRITHGVLENWMIRYEWSNERGFTANQDCQRELEDMSIRFLVEEFEKRLEDNVSSGKQRHLDASLSGAYGKLEQV